MSGYDIMAENIVGNRIYEIQGKDKTGKLSADDRLALASLLIKAGYSVKIGRERPNGTGAYRYYIEYREE